VTTVAPEADKRRRRLTGSAHWVRRRPRADVGFLVLMLIIGLAAAPIASGLGLNGPGVRDLRAVDLFGNPTGPGGSHPLGVDGSGRDVLSRILFGLRSLVLISLAASALAALVSAGLGALAGLNPWVRWLRDRLLGALGSYPALLLGLALGATLNGIWRLIVPIAVVTLARLASPRQMPAALGLALSRAVVIDFSLTFVGLGPGGHTPQLGAMVAAAGAGIVAGVPAWWALVFPGLAVMFLLVPAQRLSRFLAPALAVRADGPQATRNPGAGRFGARLVQLVIVCALAGATFKGLAGAGPQGGSPLAPVGHGLAASGSLLLGGLVVWLGVAWLHLRLLTRTPRRRRAGPGRMWRWLGRPLASMPAVLLAAAPAGWLGFLVIYAFSDSVGTLPILPGPGAYVGLTDNPGHWAQALVLPWLVLGLIPAARTALTLNRAAHATGVAQQRVARAAGVPERTLARQRRRALWAPLIGAVEAAVPAFVGMALIIELAFGIPGAGAVIAAANGAGQAATVSDMALLVAVAVILITSALRGLQGLADPRAVRG
jgi:ABC-type dipeptide/oligopeptide/nickel transport system permease subunit